MSVKKILEKKIFFMHFVWNLKTCIKSPKYDRWKEVASLGSFLKIFGNSSARS